MILASFLPTPTHLLSIILLVLGFGFVIFWHELGHFLAAKFVGIKVEQFAVGFGQAMISWRKGIGIRLGNTQKDYRERTEQFLAAREKAEPRFGETGGFTDAQISQAAHELGLGETEYRLNWIPLGGYVKMLGQDDLKPDAQAEDPRAFNKKSVGARMLVISAGVIMNVILAAVGFMILFLWGFRIAPAYVGNIIPGSPAAHAGLHIGDRIQTYDGKPQSDFTKIALYTALSHVGEKVEMHVQRPINDDPETKGFQELTLYVLPGHPPGDTQFLQVGFSAPRLLQGPAKEKLDPDEHLNEDLTSPEERLLGPGDTIIAVNGVPVAPNDYIKFDNMVQAAEGKALSLTIRGADGKLRENQKAQPHFEIPFDGELSFAGMIPRVAVSDIQEGSPLEHQLQPLDVIASLTDADPLQHPSRMQLMDRLKQDSEKGVAVSLTILRDGKSVPLPPVKLNVKLGEGRRGLGISPAFDERNTVLATVIPGSAADRAGLKPGDTLKSVAGEPVQTWYDVHYILSHVELDKTSHTASIPITYSRPQANAPATAQLQLDAPALDEIRGMRYLTDLRLDEYTILRQTTHPLVAARWGMAETRDFILQFYLTLRRMMTRDISPSNMMGPVGIFGTGTQIAYRGNTWLLWFLCMISANLAVVNFLPIPVVDGGQFVFLILEKIKGKPLSPMAMTVAQYAGLAFLAAVVLFVTYHDIHRLIG